MVTAGTDYFLEYIKAVRPPGEAADRNSGEPAVRAALLRERDLGSQGELWVFPYLLSERADVMRAVGAGFPSDDERIRYFYRQGAVDANVSVLKLIVEGRRNAGVRVLDVRARIHRRTDPLDGCTLLTPGPQGVGASAMIGFDLDARRTSAARVTEEEYVDVFTEGYFGESYFRTETVGLPRTEQHVFQVTARTTRHCVEWSLEVVVLVDNVEEVYEFGINDRPLVTTALHPKERLDGPAGLHALLNPRLDRYAEVYIDSRFTGQTGNHRSAVFVRAD